MSEKIFNVDVNLAGNQVKSAIFENAAKADMEVAANQVKGRFYFDTTSNTFKYWNGSKWSAGAEGALTAIGTLDASLKTETDTKKKTVPTGLTGALVNKGDTWFVAKAGKYSYVDSDGASVTKSLNPADFLFCVEADAEGKTNAKWSLVSAGDSLAVYEFKYDASATTTKTWDFNNTLMTNDVFFHLYKETTTTAGTKTTTTRIEEEADISVYSVDDTSDSSTSYKIKIDFGRELVAGETYKLVVGTL